MKLYNKFINICACIFLLSSCNSPQADFEKVDLPELIKDSTIKYAQRFSISNAKNYKVIHLLAETNSGDTTNTFVLYNSVKPQLNFKNIYYIKTPCSKIIALSSIYTNMIAELGRVKSIVAIENADYYNNADVLHAIESGRIVEVQRNPEVDKEAVLKLSPDIIFAFGMNHSANNFDSKIVEANIPIAMCLDHLERTPLARAEWIKFFAAFLNRSDEASIIFAEVEKDYLMLKELAKVYKDKPKILTELKFGDVWYVPGGKSFMAQLISDANGEYFWKDDTLSGSLQLSFEAVYKKAQNADLWLNVSLCTSKQQILAQDKRYGDFEAFKTNSIYNNNLHCNKSNYTSYWETGMIYPNRILSDMIQIFHNQAKEDLKLPFYYYRQLN